ncbi:hypothetical protein HMPREF9104_02004 [Lentilactobacillus kisonensis F0435]|uniref:Uncharacterized protein n=1 Tax=Lentilactobacillus kisonensis F0435 TaxID=797516 RepID=H1LHB4_9LACO|nr:hypothetical protein HMPREF9104_02004 [Lentilactobacillus kisonensis F0435]
MDEIRMKGRGKKSRVSLFDLEIIWLKRVRLSRIKVEASSEVYAKIGNSFQQCPPFRFLILMSHPDFYSNIMAFF